MDYEKKYKEALERAREWYNKIEPDSYTCIVESIFPELKESEDEMTKYEIIAFVEQSIHRGGGTPIPQEQEDRWIAWLEKQGEQKSIDDLTQQEAMDIAVAKCFEQGGQKPVDKVEPKFKVGDTIKYVGERKEFATDEYTIKEICNDCYITTYGNKIPFRMQEYYVIVNDTKGLKKIETSLPSFDEAQGTPVIKQELHQNPITCMYSTDNYMDKERKTLCEGCNISCKYNPAAWSEEDKRIMSAISQLLKDCESENCWNCVYSNDREVFFADIEKWLKSLKDRFSFHQNNLSADDEINYRILQAIICNSDTSSTLANKLSNWLESLKGKVLPQLKKEWSEDDEKIRKEIIEYIKGSWFTSDTETRDKYITWIESQYKKEPWNKDDDQYLLICKNALAKYQVSDKWDAAIISYWLENKLKAPQNKWKPSDEQIEALESAMENCAYSEYQDCLKELIVQLKKL